MCLWHSLTYSHCLLYGTLNTVHLAMPFSPRVKTSEDRKPHRWFCLLSFIIQPREKLRTRSCCWARASYDRTWDRGPWPYLLPLPQTLSVAGSYVTVPEPNQGTRKSLDSFACFGSCACWNWCPFGRFCGQGSNAVSLGDYNHCNPTMSLMNVATSPLQLQLNKNMFFPADRDMESLLPLPTDSSFLWRYGAFSNSITCCLAHGHRSKCPPKRNGFGMCVFLFLGGGILVPHNASNKPNSYFALLPMSLSWPYSEYSDAMGIWKLWKFNC